MLEPPGVVLDRFPWMLFAQKVAAQNPKQTLQTNTWKLWFTFLPPVTKARLCMLRLYTSSLLITGSKVRPITLAPESDMLSVIPNAMLFSASALSSFELQSSNYWNYWSRLPLKELCPQKYDLSILPPSKIWHRGRQKGILVSNMHWEQAKSPK